MQNFTAVVEKCHDTGLYIAYVPGFPGAHTQAATLEEVRSNLREVISMLLKKIARDISIAVERFAGE